MGRSGGIFDILVDLEKQYNKSERERIKRENMQIIANNYQIVEDANMEIERKINKINNFHKTAILEKFDYETYYSNKLIPLEYEEYTSLAKPNEKILRRKLGCIKQNNFLEKMFKNRTAMRISREKCFELEWKRVCEQYDKDEKENLKQYNEYKKKLKKENDAINKKVFESKKKYENYDLKEIGDVVSDFLFNNTDFKNNSIGAKEYSVIMDDNKIWTIRINFLRPKDILPKVKKYTYLKSKNIVRETYFSENEKEKIFNKIVFNTALSLLSTIGFAFPDKVEAFVVNCYFNDIDLSTGKEENRCIMSAMLNQSDINYENLEFIESRAFFDSVGARYNKPLLDLKKVSPYSVSTVDSIDYINNEINGFDFEHLSKKLLESNGFDDVVVTQASGDYGADIIAKKDGVKYAVQCKKFSSKVGVKAVQEVMASREMYHCHVGAILTNNYFTPNAIKLAEKNNILLWDKNYLTKMLETQDNENNN